MCLDTVGQGSSLHLLSLQGTPPDMPVFTEQMVRAVWAGPAGRVGGAMGGVVGGAVGAAVTLAAFLQQVQQEQLDSVMDWLTNQPRAAQLLDKDGTFLSTLEHFLSRYLKDVRQHHVKADKRWASGPLRAAADRSRRKEG